MNDFVNVLDDYNHKTNVLADNFYESYDEFYTFW